MKGLKDHMEQRKVLIIYTGGTIGMAGVGPYTNTQEAIRWVLDQADLPDGCKVVTTERILDSSQLDYLVIGEILELIGRYHKAFDGFVIVGGTDTMAYLQSCLKWHITGLRKPVLLTGSIRVPSDEPLEGPDNIRKAVEVALSNPGAGMVGIVMDGRILLGGTRKANSTAKLPYEESQGSMIQRWWEEKEMEAARMDQEAVFTEVSSGSIEVLWMQPFVKPSDGLTAGALCLAVYGQGTLPDSEAVLRRIRNYIGEGKPVVVVSEATVNSLDAGLYEAGGKIRELDLILAPGSFIEEAIGYLSARIHK